MGNILPTYITYRKKCRDLELENNYWIKEHNVQMDENYSISLQLLDAKEKNKQLELYKYFWMDLDSVKTERNNDQENENLDSDSDTDSEYFSASEDIYIHPDQQEISNDVEEFKTTSVLKKYGYPRTPVKMTVLRKISTLKKQTIPPNNNRTIFSN